MAQRAANHDLGHPALDEQHRHLLNLHFEALDALRAGNRDGAVMTLLALEAAVGEHFAFEEALMRDSGYPERAMHEDAHRQFGSDLAKLIAALAEGASAAATALWLDSRNGSWWRMHIRTNDASLARHLALVPAPPPAARAEAAPPGP
ncbi:MAG: bacteriohemerythrin [Anaeromyxobacteraceae bacterium]